jgi:hypothetical protein
MKRLLLLTVITFTVWFSVQLSAAPPADNTPAPPDGSFALDQTTFLNINDILMFAYNNGKVANDDISYFGRRAGFYFPYSGDPTAPGDLTAVYTAGLWLGGEVAGETRIAVAEYGTEFVPGPMVGGGPAPDDPSFRVYKIDRMSGPGDPDYDEWPVDQGAPADEFGKPLLLGDQTLWAVFNDADPIAHDNIPGQTDPLDVEVQMTVWSTDLPEENRALFVRYKLYNKGLNDIDDFYICFWVDPDVGDIVDDLVGCDVDQNMFFAYNDGPDAEYGDIPPAWGGRLLSGPVVPSPGDVAVFDGHALPDHKNLPMTAFLKYINGTDPTTPEEAFNHMKGLNADGSEIIDPTTSLPTTFMFPGDPVAGTGWIDDDPNDVRMLISMGPISFAAGDSQQVVLKLGAQYGDDALSSVGAVKSTLNQTAMKAVIEPNKVHSYYTNAYDPRYATVYFGNMVGPNTLYDIDPATIRVNDSLVPQEVEILPSHVEFAGPVYRVYFKIANFIEGFHPLWDLSTKMFHVSGYYLGVRCSFDGELTFFGHISGDADGSGYVDIDDVVFLVAYMFTGGPSPRPLALGDADCSGYVDIDDITYLVQYIFANGAQPCPNGH